MYTPIYFWFDHKEYPGLFFSKRSIIFNKSAKYQKAIHFDDDIKRELLIGIAKFRASPDYEEKVQKMVDYLNRKKLRQAISRTESQLSSISETQNRLSFSSQQENPKKHDEKIQELKQKLLAIRAKPKNQ